MISNWASGHHAKLAGQSCVYQGQHSERLGDNAPSRPGVRGQRRTEAWAPVRSVHRAVTRHGVHWVHSVYTRWCEGNLKHNGPASLVSKQSLLCRLLQLEKPCCFVTRTDFETFKLNILLVPSFSNLQSHLLSVCWCPPKYFDFRLDFSSGRCNTL